MSELRQGGRQALRPQDPLLHFSLGFTYWTCIFSLRGTLPYVASKKYSQIKKCLLVIRDVDMRLRFVNFTGRFKMICCIYLVSFSALLSSLLWKGTENSERLENTPVRLSSLRKSHRIQKRAWYVKHFGARYELALFKSPSGGGLTKMGSVTF